MLVERRDPPVGYAIPGGFVNVGESAETAALRELKEETNIIVDKMEQFRFYSDPKRDHRRHTASIVFRYVHPTTTTISMKKGDDAKNVVLVPLTDILTLNLAFDHKQILTEYIIHYHPLIAKHLRLIPS